MEEKGIPTVDVSIDLLDSACARNPGPWKEHSVNCARAAQTIARGSGLNPEKAFVMGLLHDIGRGEGVTHLRHTIDGYRLLSAMDYDDIARICLTHSFPVKDIRYYSGPVDCSESECTFISDFLSSVEFDDYDLLIQLCDALALPEGITIMEKRFYDIVLRHGFNEFSSRKWKKFFEIKGYFDSKIGKSIYKLFRADIEKDVFG